MEPWRQTLADNPDLAALWSEDATFTLRLTPEERAEWETFAELTSETVEQVLRRVMKRAIDERLAYDQARRSFP
jgi:hypothetical protein